MGLGLGRLFPDICRGPIQSEIGSVIHSSLRQFWLTPIEIPSFIHVFFVSNYGKPVQTVDFVMCRLNARCFTAINAS